MTDPRPLSPAALAVVDAVMMHQFGVSSCLSRNERMRSGGIAAAALRAAADAVVPDEDAERSPCREHCVIGSAAGRIRAELLAIAAELEAQR